MLQLENVTLTQDNFTLTANWALPEAGIIAVMGPSGAGKSTLLAGMTGFLAPSAGRVLWRGHDITQIAPGARPMAVIFQDNNLFPHLTAAQNVGLGIKPSLRLSDPQRDQVAYALTRVGLTGMGGRKPAELSGGQQGRVALARVLVQSRPILLLDEPFAALGPALRAEMLDLVADVARDLAALVLMVTHVPSDAAQIADQIIVVADGCAAPPAPAKALLADPPPALQAYLGAPRP